MNTPLLGCGLPEYGRAKQKALRPICWDERHSFRGTTQIRMVLHAHLCPCNAGPTAVSPRRLPGEPNRARAVWLAAGDQTSLGGAYRLFSRSSLITLNTYSTEKRELQAPIRRNQADWGRKTQESRRPSMRSSISMAATMPSFRKKAMCLQEARPPGSHT